MEGQPSSFVSQSQNDLSGSGSKKSVSLAIDPKNQQTQIEGMYPSKIMPEITDLRSAKNLSHDSVNISQSENPESIHKFWGSQPILLNSNNELSELNSPIIQDSIAIREQPFTLSSSFEWSELDLTLDCEIQELYELLCENYVEDDDHMFRFAYSKQFLIWALKPPGWLSEFHCGVRVKTSHKLVAFISAVPAQIFVKGKLKQMVEINFLCVHEKLRNKRVAPVLIREITRRVNLKGIFQAVFTSGAKLPNRPVAVCRYWHRSLNPKKLIEVEFSYLTRNMTLQRALKLYKLPEKPITPGLRKFKLSDSKAVCDGLNLYLSRFELCPKFTETDISHWLTPHEGIIYSWVVQPTPSEPITDMISFYSIPSSVIRHPKHKHLYTAYLFYYFTTRTLFQDLLYDALILAKSNNFDVFNALDIMENKSVLEDLKFGMGDGNLQYFFYNWCCENIATDNVGLVLQ
ncbi:Glycylpeptide N-tetradecanoyltransferase 1 [Oopsacas minuta]|uniref:Glycylpeptide N-tetradecanoyltransferase n=1 Tax=Oopsacas minuta TaxID=111878 RepID=A0AAV7K3H9_9METZ|nr:Glycylpeptide N-tetradecanoyltransferase 1 [Oopsacas minuta]